MTTTLPSLASFAKTVSLAHRAQLEPRETHLDVPGYHGILVLRVHPPDFEDDGQLMADAGDDTKSSRFDSMAEFIAKCTTEVCLRAPAKDDQPGQEVPLGTLLDDGFGPVGFDERLLRWLLTAEITDDTAPEVAATIRSMADARIAQLKADGDATVATVREVIPYPPNLSGFWRDMVTWIGTEDNSAAEKALGEADAASSAPSEASPLD